MKISENITVALIAVIGVLISGVLSFFVSTYQSEVAIESLSAEIESKYNEKLYEKRLNTYPDLYRILSDLGKDLRKVELTNATLVKRLEEINEWDSKFAILLSPSSIALILDLRNVLDENTNFVPNFDPDKQVGRAVREAVFEAVLRIEQTIKKEIGVYDAEGYHNPKNADRYPYSWKYLQEK